MIPGCLKFLSGIFAEKGVTLYLVGGYVRNMVLGLPGGDFDVCSCALPDEAAAIARDAGLTVVEKALSLGTVELRMKTSSGCDAFEHTTWRRDYYPPGGDHRPYRVEFTKEMAEDAQRRDFSVNALYMNIETGEIFDPTGRGLADAAHKRLSAAADDPNITIRDDGLRIMRMARFAAELGFDAAADLKKAAQRHAALLRDISAERKWIELKKILLADTKYNAANSGPLRGLMLLRETDALRCVLPRLSEGSGIRQSEKYHAYDVLDHGFYTCAASPPILTLRLAAMLHDIGKPQAVKTGGNMYGHEIIGEQLARDELNSLKAENKTKAAVLPLIKNHMFDLEGKAKPKTIRRRAVMLGKKGFELLIALRYADMKGSGRPFESIVSADNWQKEMERMAQQRVPWCVAELQITGDDIAAHLRIDPSPVIGQILRELYQHCVNSPAQNNSDDLKRLAVAIHRKMLT